MGKLRSVNTKFWLDPFVEDLKPTDKLLFLYLLTNPLTNLLGVYEITINRICYDTGLTRQMVANGLEGFGRVRKAFFIENYMILPNWLKNQNLNRNMKIAVEKEFNALPKSLRDRLYPNGSESLWNGSESFPNGSEIESEVEVESEIECESETKRKNKEQFDFSFADDDFLPTFKNWLEYKKKRNETYKTQQSVELAYKKLLNLSGNNPKIAREVTEQSMANNWAGLFELKTKNEDDIPNYLKRVAR